MIPEAEWVFVDPMSIKPEHLIPISYFFRKLGYLDIAKVPKVIAEECNLRVLEGKEVEHQTKMKI